MKTGTSSLMDGKDYQQRKVMRIDDINAMADADITKNETETLYTKQDMIDFAQLYAIIHCMGDITKSAEQYYNETFKQQEQ
jgi:hypothetical protein